MPFSAAYKYECVAWYRDSHSTSPCLFLFQTPIFRYMAKWLPVREAVLDRCCARLKFGLNTRPQSRHRRCPKLKQKHRIVYLELYLFHRVTYYTAIDGFVVREGRQVGILKDVRMQYRHASVTANTQKLKSTTADTASLASSALHHCVNNYRVISYTGRIF